MWHPDNDDAAISIMPHPQPSSVHEDIVKRHNTPWKPFRVVIISLLQQLFGTMLHAFFTCLMLRYHTPQALIQVNAPQLAYKRLSSDLSCLPSAQSCNRRFLRIRCFHHTEVPTGMSCSRSLGDRCRIRLLTFCEFTYKPYRPADPQTILLVVWNVDWVYCDWVYYDWIYCN
jgi:hypothetical protein